jgi:hypothetical protein
MLVQVKATEQRAPIIIIIIIMFIKRGLGVLPVPQRAPKLVILLGYKKKRKMWETKASMVARTSKNLVRGKTKLGPLPAHGEQTN